VHVEAEVVTPLFVFMQVYAQNSSTQNPEFVEETSDALRNN